MKCAVHAEVDATGYCRNCGKALCGQCTRDVRGIHYCEECLAAQVAKPMPAPGGPNPGLAGLLGIIPGLGAVYNGEYTKGLIHVMIFAGIITLLAGEHVRGYEPFFGMMIPTFIAYMVIEAYRTAKARQMGQAAPTALPEVSSNQPVGAFVLIGIGLLFLLNNFGILSIGRILEFWPVILIALGLWMLRKRM